MKLDSKECQIIFGEFIRKAREDKKLSQTAAADLIGVSQSYLSYVESGDREIYLTLAMKICDTLGADMKDFIEKLI